MEVLNDLESLKIINSSTNMMKIMNKSLLDSQAISDGNLRLQYRVMNPKDSLKQLIEFFAIQIDAKKMKINISFNNEHEFPTNVVCDNDRFQEMVFHILANSIKFNMEENGEVDI